MDEEEVFDEDGERDADVEATDWTEADDSDSDDSEDGLVSDWDDKELVLLAFGDEEEEREISTERIGRDGEICEVAAVSDEDDEGGEDWLWMSFAAAFPIL